MPGAGSWNVTLAAAMAALNSNVIDSKAYVLRSTRLVPATSEGSTVPAATRNGWAVPERGVEGMGVKEFMVSSPVLFRFSVRD